MAAKTEKTAKKVTGYKIKVVANPTFVGVGAGGIQFAYGEAIIAGGTIVNWYREHDGYDVTEITEDTPGEEPKE